MTNKKAVLGYTAEIAGYVLFILILIFVFLFLLASPSKEKTQEATSRVTPEATTILHAFLDTTLIYNNQATTIADLFHTLASQWTSQEIPKDLRRIFAQKLTELTHEENNRYADLSISYLVDSPFGGNYLPDPIYISTATFKEQEENQARFLGPYDSRATLDMPMFVHGKPTYFRFTLVTLHSKP